MVGTFRVYEEWLNSKAGRGGEARLVLVTRLEVGLV